METKTLSSLPPSLPHNFRIREKKENSKIKYTLEKKWYFLYFLSLWIRVKKVCLNILPDTYGTHMDSDDRAYAFVVSDGNCQSYEEVIEFFHYKPKKPYMKNIFGNCVFEVWANNTIAKNFLKAGRETHNIDKSRIGIFFSTPTQTYFVPKGGHWESAFKEVYQMKKIGEIPSFEEMREEIIADLKTVNELDPTFTVITGGKSYTPNQIIEELEKETDFGKEYVENTIKGLKFFSEKTTEPS